MLKGAALTLSALTVLLVLAAGIVFGARSLPVRISYVEQQDCLSRAKAEHDKHPDCPKTETLWERGLSDPVAFYTLWLTLFTLALAIGAAFQSGLIGRQIALAREEFSAAHRPRLEVRFVHEANGGVELTVINTGTSAAKFIEARAIILNLFEGVALPSPHDIPPAGSFTLRSRFEPSASDRYTVTFSQTPFEAAFGCPIHLFGWIAYETTGPKPVRRVTYFGRKAAVLQPELVPLEGSDWNFIQ